MDSLVPNRTYVHNNIFALSRTPNRVSVFCPMSNFHKTYSPISVLVRINHWGQRHFLTAWTSFSGTRQKRLWRGSHQLSQLFFAVSTCPDSWEGFPNIYLPCYKLNSLFPILMVMEKTDCSLHNHFLFKNLKMYILFHSFLY